MGSHLGSYSGAQWANEGRRVFTGPRACAGVAIEAKPGLWLNLTESSPPAATLHTTVPHPTPHTLTA